MYITFKVPDEWHEKLRQAALSSGEQSVSDFVRGLIAQEIGEEKPVMTWGGKRNPSGQKGKIDDQQDKRMVE